jgi:hypothetical protein
MGWNGRELASRTAAKTRLNGTGCRPKRALLHSGDHAGRVEEGRISQGASFRLRVTVKRPCSLDQRRSWAMAPRLPHLPSRPQPKVRGAHALAACMVSLEASVGRMAPPTPDRECVQPCGPGTICPGGVTASAQRYSHTMPSESESVYHQYSVSLDL